MRTILTWKKGLFSNTYSLFSNGTLTGELTDKTFSKYAHGELNGKKYTFRTTGIFKQHTEILDEDNRMIGMIAYYSMMTRATITLDGRAIKWKYDNPWNTKWRIYSPEGIEVKYSGSSTHGQIDGNTDEALLVLIGLFVTNYYWQLTIVVLLVVFLPIWMSVLN